MSDACWCMEGLREACHDIRQPIAGVLALAGAALALADLPDNARTCLDQIVELAQWQSEVIEHWLQVPADDDDPAHHTDVMRVINEAIAAERATWTGEFTVVWPAESVFVSLPEVTMRRVVANLLANAARAAGAAGTVTVEVFRQAGSMMLAVEDDGPGFGRLPAGSGLGLPAVAREAVKHQGRLECGRGRLGGARVALWLPEAASQNVRGAGKVADAARAV
ncbi:MAG: hypothetical protein JO132_07485 [Streptosporangiaceae bacterium]|nr:hypothetical protein [Streptosporangiaceae bacterium]